MEALADLAEQILLGNTDIVENDLGNGACTHAHEILVAADGYALALMNINEQANGAFCAVGSFILAVGLEEISLTGTGDKRLCAVYDETVAVKHGGRLHARCVRACAGLGKRECRALFALDPRHNIFLLLSLGTVVQDGEAHIRLAGNGFCNGAAGFGELLNGEHIVYIAAAQSAVLLGDDDAAEAQLVHFLEQRLNAEQALVDLQRVRADAFIGVLFIYLL